MTKRTTGELVFAFFNTIGMIGLIFVFLIPIWHVAMGSISNPGLLSAHTGLILQPLGEATLGGYRLVFANDAIITAYMNTLIYVVGATSLGVGLTILAAYCLSRPRLYFKSLIAFMITFTMIFSGGLIPTFMVVRDLGLLDTRWALIIPNAKSVFLILIMRTSFAQVPESLSEAALMDGAGHFRILFQIILPVSKAIVAVVGLFYGIQHWNAWFHASIYLRDRGLFPLQLALREIVIMNQDAMIIGAAEAADVEMYRFLIQYATIMVAIIPMMMIYPFVQKYFVKGVMIGSIKG